MIERVIIRRFAKASRLILMVVTVGLAQFFVFIAVVLPYWLADDLIVPAQTLPQPFDFSLEIHPIIFHANDLIGVIVTLLCIVGLFSFLRFTSIGIALRASSESADRSSLLGVNVGFTHNVAWMIAAFLSAVTMILRAGTIGLPLGPAFGPSILVKALAAAVIGKMENFPVMFAAACGIGIVESPATVERPDRARRSRAVHHHHRRAAPAAATPRVARRRPGRLELAGREPTSARSPASSRGSPRCKWAFRILRLAVVAFAIALPFMLDDQRTNLAAAVLIYAIIAVSLVLLTGWAGEISLGQVAFVAIGSATAGALNVHYQWGAIETFLAAGAVGAIASVIIGLPALRIRGLMLAVTTLAFAVMTSSFLLNRDQSFLGISFDYLPDNLIDRVERYPIFGIHSVLGPTARHRRPRRAAERDRHVLRVPASGSVSCSSRCAGSTGGAPCATSSRRVTTSATRRRSGSARPRRSCSRSRSPGSSPRSRAASSRCTRTRSARRSSPRRRASAR